MGQKCSSTSLRLGINKGWLSNWNAPDRPTTIKWILEDEKARKYLNKRCEKAGVGLIQIERGNDPKNRSVFTVFLHLSQPGYLETNEKELNEINSSLTKIVGKTVNVRLRILELKNPNVSAVILGKDIANALQNRVPFRSTMKRTLRRAMSSGAKGIKIKVTGRLNGVEIARSESYSEGSVPLSTLRADIDYSFTIAKTTYGVIGVKVWVNRGLYFGKHFMPLPEAYVNPKWRDRNSFISRSY